MNNTGVIIKGIGGFYYVDIGDSVIECKARGNFRNKKMSPYVGDTVDISYGDDNKGTIDNIHERKNFFIRPPVSNVDEMIIVASVQNPMPDLLFIDKMLVIAKHSNVNVRICFNKHDLADNYAEELVKLYSDAGFDAFYTSVVEDIGIEAVRKSLNNKITVFSGFSGVGKSSLLNAVMNTSVMETGEVSKKLKRGKHTTRHVELIKFHEGYIVDTPGFSMLDFPDDVTKDNLKNYFCEFNDYELQCKFRDCNHMGTSGVCAVCKAVEDGYISESRFSDYKYFYEILSQRKEWKK